MTLRSFAALAALTLAALAAPAHAQILTLKPSVKHIEDTPTYIAALWPGQRVNFYDSDLFEIFDANSSWASFWVFDINNTGTLDLTISSQSLKTYPEGAFLSIGPAPNAVCYPNRWCPDLYPLGESIARIQLPGSAFVPRKVSLRIENIPYGRYVMALSGITGPRRASFTGQMTLRPTL